MGIKAVIIPEKDVDGTIRVNLIDVESEEILISIPVDSDLTISLTEDYFIDYNYKLNVSLKVDEIELR